MSQESLPEPKPDRDDAYEKLILALNQFLTSEGPEDLSEGPELVIELEPRDFADDPRTLFLIQMLTKAGLRIKVDLSMTKERESLVGQLHEGHTTMDVSDAVKKMAGSELDKQAIQAAKDRAQGKPRSASPDELIRLRDSFMQSVASLNQLANCLAEFCAEQIRTGCTSWQEIPEPLRSILTGMATTGAGVAIVAQPLQSTIIAISIIALLQRRRRTSS